MAKRRAAFLLKQQRKAQEARLRKQQQEVESELKRDETRYVVSHTQIISKVKELSKSLYKTGVFFHVIIFFRTDVFVLSDRT